MNHFIRTLALGVLVALLGVSISLHAENPATPPPAPKEKSPPPPAAEKRPKDAAKGKNRSEAREKEKAKERAQEKRKENADSPQGSAAAQEILERMGLLRRSGPFQRDNNEIKAAFRDVVKDANRSVVRIYSNGKLLALGAIVDERGYIATKASELADPLEAQLFDGRKLPAKLVAVHNDFDLALLSVKGEKLVPIAWREGPPPLVGSWLATPGLGNEPLSIGVVSVAPRRIAGTPGVLGVALDESPAGPVIKEVIVESAAAKAGIKPGDLVLKLNGRDVANRDALISSVRTFKPGDSISLKLARGNSELELAATLGGPPQDDRVRRRESMNSMGGPLSERRKGFPVVLQHDTILQPNECGGPVLDLSGKAVGLNIARAGRVESYAAPAAEVRKLLPDMIAGKFPPTAIGNNPAAESAAKKPAAPAAEGEPAATPQ